MHSGCRTRSTSCRWISTGRSCGSSTDGNSSRPWRGAPMDGPPTSRLRASGQPRRLLRPGYGPYVDHGNTWVLCHKNVFKKKITDKRLLDDVIIEATWKATLSGSGRAAIISRSWTSARRPGTSWPAIPTAWLPAAAWETGCTSTACRSWARTDGTTRGSAVPS